MKLVDFCSGSRVMVVAGKGGVGKTTVTASLAVAAARAGRNVLIVEVEGKSGLTAAFRDSSSTGAASPASPRADAGSVEHVSEGNGASLDYDDVELSTHIRARTLTPDAALVEYLEDHGMRRISKRLAGSSALDVVATAVPGMRDILVLGKIKQLEQRSDADLIIVDAPAAGHAVSFLMSPAGLLDAVRVGPIRRQAEEVVAMLRDGARCQVLLVTLPEETPINELIDTAYALEDRVGVQLGPVIVNGCAAEPPQGQATSTGSDTRLAAALDAATAWARHRWSLQQHQINRLASRLALPQIHLPQLSTTSINRDDVDVLAEAFVHGLEQL